MPAHTWIGAAASVLVALLACSCATIPRQSSTKDVEPPGDPHEALLDALQAHPSLGESLQNAARVLSGFLPPAL